MDPLSVGIRRQSKGYLNDPPAQIHPMILIGAGAMLTPEFVKENRISHVINCAQDEMCPSWFSSAYPDKYKCINAIDSIHVNIVGWYPDFKETMQKFLREPGCTKVFVHCQCGINRSAFLTLLYVCDVFGFSMPKTHLSILFQRPCALTNTVFSRQVFDFLETLR
jgi:hypothetical protein